MKFRTIFCWALGAHFLALGLAAFLQPKPKSNPLKPMRTTAVQLKIPEKPPQQIQPEKAPAPKKPAAKKTAAKKNVAKKAPAPKKISKSAPKKNAPTTSKPSPPSAFPPVEYQHLLIHRLKSQLELPELGSVEVKISFGERGEVAKIEVLSSQSGANSRYLISAIKKIELPPLPRSLRGKCAPLIIEFSACGS